MPLPFSKRRSSARKAARASLGPGTMPDSTLNCCEDSENLKRSSSLAVVIGAKVNNKNKNANAEVKFVKGNSNHKKPPPIRNVLDESNSHHDYETDDVSSITDSHAFTMGSTSFHTTSGGGGGGGSGGLKGSHRKSSTTIIKPRSDSIRVGMERATSALTMSTLRFQENSLYGRDRELKQLKEIFSRAKFSNNGCCSNLSHEDQQKRRQLVLIGGAAGAGKSALVYNLKTTITREAGFFLSGKFDLQQSDEPYTAFTMACRELCDSLLAHKENPDRPGNKWQFTFEEMQETLQRELCRSNDGDANELQVLTTVFPDLATILGGDYLSDTPFAAGNSSSEFMDDRTTASGGQRVSIGYLEAKNRFNYAFRRLMRIVSSFGRVALFLDDVQWADAASLDLVKTLITDCRDAAVPQPCSSSVSEAFGVSRGEEQGLIVLATFRSDEVDERHPLTATLRELDSVVQQDPTLSLDIQNIPVGNLDLHQVNELLVDVLSADSPEKTLSLAECIHRKTQGNVFYVIQFLKSLTADRGDDPPLLQFNMGTLRWVWNTDEIQVHESATKNVVEIIQQKMNTLPAGIRKLLPIVACLGTSFEVSVFKHVLKHFNDMVFFPRESSKGSGPEDVEKPAPPADAESSVFMSLSSDKSHPDAFHAEDFILFCSREGLMVFDEKRESVKWDHDKIIEAAIALADPEDLATWRYRLGEFLMGEFDQKGRETNIFVLVHLLDQDSTTVPKNNPKRLMLAELNRTAGDRAMKHAAFQSAASYLSRSIQLLPEDSWNTHYKLSLNIYSLAAEAHHCIGNMEETQAYCKAVIAIEEAPGRSILDKRRAWTTLLDSIAAGGHTVLAQEKCLEVLGLLGCKFPKRGWIFHTLGSLVKTEMNVKNMEQQISGLPIMKDASKQWVMRLLDKLVSFAFQNKSDIFPLVIFKGLKYTLKYGISDYAPPTLCTVGLLLAAALGDLDGCRKFGDMSLNLFDHVGKNGDKIKNLSKPRTQFVAASFVLHWKMPLASLRKVLLDGYRGGLGNGDIESALWSIMVYLETGYQLGLPLAMLAKDCEVYRQQMKDLQQDQMLWSASALHQLLLNLLGAGEEGEQYHLEGRVFSLKKLLSFPDDSHSNAKGHGKRLSVDNAFWAGDFAATVAMVEEFGAHKGYFDKQYPGIYGLPPLHFNCGLACYAEFQRTGKRKLLPMAKFHSSKIEEWATKGDPNVVHYAKILEAEKMSMKKKAFPDAVKLYKESITLSGRQGCRHVQALANERLGEFYIRHELESDAAYHLLEAVRLYRDWGNHNRAYRLVRREYGKFGAFLQGAAPSSFAIVSESAPFGGMSNENDEASVLD